MKRCLSFFLAAVLCLSLCACGRQEKEQVQHVEELIRAIGEVDAESGPRIEAAEQAYNALEEKQQQQIGGAFYLPLARKELEKLLAEQAEQKAAAEEKAARQSYELSVQGDWDEAEDILEQIAENVDMLVAISTRRRTSPLPILWRVWRSMPRCVCARTTPTASFWRARIWRSRWPACTRG